MPPITKVGGPLAMAWIALLTGEKVGQYIRVAIADKNSARVGDG